MYQSIMLLVLLSTAGYATTLNHTLIDQCTGNFTNCSSLTTNCTQVFNNCLSKAEIHPQKPQDCYQSEAAFYALQTVFWVSFGLVTSSLFLNNLALIIRFLIKRFSCCVCASELLEIVTKDTPSTEPAVFDTVKTPTHSLELFKLMTSKTATTLGPVFTGVITYVSAGWIYNLWQLWTSKDADCKYHLDQQ